MEVRAAAARTASSKRAPARRAKAEPEAPSDRFTPDVARWFTKGNKVTPLFDPGVTPRNSKDEIFKQVKLAIDAARHSVQLEMFGFGLMDIAEALVGARERDLPVQVVIDPVNEDWEAEKGPIIDYLREHDVDVRLYPVEQAEGRFPQIQHAKMLIVDGEKAIIGGMNWGSHSPLNRDADVMVEGPAVDKMEALFGKDYLKSGGKRKDLIPIEETPEHPEGKSAVSLVSTSADPKDRSMVAALGRAIRTSQKSIHAELFVLSDWKLVKGLVEAKERGCDVKILLHPLEIDGNRINEKACKQLREAGVEVLWYPINQKTGGKLHAKVGIFDGEEVIVGSANWSGAGMTYNREAGVDVFDTEVADRFETEFERDWKKGTDEPVYVKDKAPAQ